MERGAVRQVEGARPRVPRERYDLTAEVEERVVVGHTRVEIVANVEADAWVGARSGGDAYRFGPLGTKAVHDGRRCLHGRHVALPLVHVKLRVSRPKLRLVSPVSERNTHW